MLLPMTIRYFWCALSPLPCRSLSRSRGSDTELVHCGPAGSPARSRRLVLLPWVSLQYVYHEIHRSKTVSAATVGPQPPSPPSPPPPDDGGRRVLPRANAHSFLQHPASDALPGSAGTRKRPAGCAEVFSPAVL